MKWGLSQECKVGSAFKIQCNSPYHQSKKTNKQKKMIISVNTETAFYKIQYPLIIKFLAN